jgi:tungstate transport system substrate-binding protein
MNMTHAQSRFITLASTTSTEQSGLFAHLLPAFQKQTGIAVRVLAVGTGQALDLARRGDADAVLVHDPAAEEKFVAEGFGLARVEMMANDFVLLGPRDDPARARGRDVRAAMLAIYAAQAAFVSRGDHSGTHAAELRAWRSAGRNPAQEKALWYREIGQGMGAALNTAAAMNAYVLSDRGTWLAFKNRQQLSLLVEGDTSLRNPYGAMVVNPARHAHVKHADAQTFVDWLISPAGQQTIATYKINGESLFFPIAKR